MHACPSKTTLRDLGKRELSEATFARVEEHVESCPRCQEFLQTIALDDDDDVISTAISSLKIPGFVIERELGQGSNGVVYLARETKLDRPVALKFISNQETSGAPRHEYWLTEAQAVARLTDPNVVRLYQVIEVERFTVLVLEYLSGGTLKDRLSTPLAPRQAASIVETIAQTIDRIHNQRILHLDIKPSNILIDGEPGIALNLATFKVSDFGIARAHSESKLGEYRVLQGTPSYMAPEQTGLMDVPLGPATDVYALGALLYHLLTGRPPFQSPTTDQTIEMVRTVEPVSLRRLSPQIPRDLEIICLHCLKKEPGQRYPSADLLAKDVRRFLDGRPITVRPVSSIEKVVSWCRRRPGMAATLLALAVTLLASFSGLVFFMNQLEFDRDQAVKAQERAEDNEKATSRSLKELETWVQIVLDDPTLLQEQPLPALVDGVRSLTENLHGDGESIPRMNATVSKLHRDLARKIAVRPDRLNEASTLLARSRQHLSDSLKRNPDSEVLRSEYVMIVLECGAMASRRLAYEEAERDYAEVAALAPALTDRETRILSLLYVSMKRCVLATRLFYEGEGESSNRILTANLRMLDTMPHGESGLPDLRLQRAMTLGALGRAEEAIPILGELTQVKDDDRLRTPDRKERPDDFISTQALKFLLDWHAVPQDTSEEVHMAKEVIAEIRRLAHAIGIAEPDVPAIAMTLSGQLQVVSGIKRRQQKLEEAESIQRKFSAFANQIVIAFPDQPYSHMVLSESYIQISKNAFQRLAREEAIDAIRRSLDTARKASSLDANCGEASLLVVDRQRRLSKVLGD